MAQKRLVVTNANGDQRTVSVLDTTTVREIMQQCHEDGVQDREAMLIRGVTPLEPDMTVNEAGLEDGNEITLVWSDPFVEMARWTGEEMGQELYVRIPPETTSIDPGAFRHCKALVKVVMPNSVTSIGAGAFHGCRSLTQVEIPDSLTSIGERVFASCSSLTQVEIPNSVTKIGMRAFSRCTSLTHVEVPKSVTSIEWRAFANCTSLTRIEIPDSVTSFGQGVFDGCSSLQSREHS